MSDEFILIESDSPWYDNIENMIENDPIIYDYRVIIVLLMILVLILWYTIKKIEI